MQRGKETNDMNETVQPAQTPQTDLIDFIVKWEAQEKERLKANRAQVKGLLDVLKLRGVACVQMEYNGSGDSGAVESVRALSGMPYYYAESADVQPTEIKEIDLTEGEKTIFEEFAYQFLASKHLGWENNSGGSGTVTIEIATAKATLDHTEYYEESINSTDEIDL